MAALAQRFLRLKFYREDFLRTSPDLTAYINRHLGEEIPEGYKVAFIDYDWTVNDSRKVSPPN